MDAKKLIEMKQERATLTNSLRALMSQYETVEMPGDKQAEMKTMEDRFDALTAKITSEEAQLNRERAIGEAVKPDAPKSEIRDLFAKALTGETRHVDAYRNALSLGVDATAGNLTAPMEFRNELIKGLDDLLFMRQLATIKESIGAAQSLGFPYRSTAAADATWVAEVTTAPEETALEYGRREFKPNKMAKLIKMSRTLVQHAPNADTTVMDEMRFRILAGQENGYLNGNGTAQPLGIFTASATGINTDRDVSTGNTDTTVTFDGLQEAKYSVKQQYQRGASWVGHRTLAKMLAKIKDGEGQYVWQGSVINGQPDNLLGAPFYMSEYAPNTFTTGLYVAVYGNFKQGYWIVDANEIYVQVLRELYAATNQIGYIVDYFGDGAPVLPEAFARVKLA